MIQATSFIHGEFEHFFGAWGEAKFTRNNAISTPNDKLNGITNLGQVHAEIAQHRSRDACILAHKAKQEVFSADVIVLEALGIFPRKSQDPPGPHGEFLKPVRVILTEYAKRLQEILFLLTQLLYLIIVVLERLLRADRLLFTWLLPAFLVVTLARPVRL